MTKIQTSQQIFFFSLHNNLDMGIRVQVWIHIGFLGIMFFLYFKIKLCSDIINVSGMIRVDSSEMFRNF